MTISNCLLILLLNFFTIHAKILPNISLGSYITAGTNETWQSMSGEFAFGFYRLPSNLYLLGIWLDKIPERTLIWSANRDSPAEAGSTILLANAGSLFLNFFNGSVQTVYDDARASLGFMQDDGNFVLKDSNSRVLWGSFDSPTDTLLPGQVLRSKKKLLSNANSTIDYSTGNFMLEMQGDGNLVLSAFRFCDPGYWFTIAQGDNVNFSLVFDPNASLYMVNSTGDEINSLRTNVSAPVGEYYHRAMIDDHGNFQHFVYHISNGSGWVSVWQAFDEPCLANAVCGVNGMCTSPDNKTITCKCIPGHIPLDPQDVSKGCHPETVMNYCADPLIRNFTIEVIDDADFPLENFADLSRVLNVDEDGCKEALTNDCYSMAASLIDSRCIKKRAPLLNARKSSSTRGKKAFVKVPMQISNPGNLKPEKKNDFNLRAFLKISLIVSVILVFLFGALAINYHPAAQKFIRRKYSSNASTVGINFRKFKYLELDEATNGFSKTLGRGSSAKVYSGILRSGDAQIGIAVKKLTKDIEKSEEEFTTELRIIGRTYHRNLVRLLGFCVENDQRLLVYELMSNGTLSDLLFGKEERPSWVVRVEILHGIARGLLYLHEECETQIIHCDIKPQNVLLDANYNAKISDFGLSKLLNNDQTRTETNLRGTYGYLAPEWLRSAPVTSKVDVYSFGVMLLEILCCRRQKLNPDEEEIGEDDLVLTDLVIDGVITGKLEMVVDHDPEILIDFERFERMALVGIWCIHPDPVLRPSMKKISQMLEGTMEVGDPPLLHELRSNPM